MVFKIDIYFSLNFYYCDINTNSQCHWVYFESDIFIWILNHVNLTPETKQNIRFLSLLERHPIKQTGVENVPARAIVINHYFHLILSVMLFMTDLTRKLNRPQLKV